MTKTGAKLVCITFMYVRINVLAPVFSVQGCGVTSAIKGRWVGRGYKACLPLYPGVAQIYAAAGKYMNITVGVLREERVTCNYIIDLKLE